MCCSCHILVCIGGSVSRRVSLSFVVVFARKREARSRREGSGWGGRERGRKGGGDPGRTYPRARCRRRGRSSSSSRRGRLRGGEGERGTGQSGRGRDEAASSRETRPGVGCAPRGGARPTPGRAGRARRGETHRRECPPSRVCFATQEGGIATCDGVNGEPRQRYFFRGDRRCVASKTEAFSESSESDVRSTPRRASVSARRVNAPPWTSFRCDPTRRGRPRVAIHHPRADPHRRPPTRPVPSPPTTRERLGNSAGSGRPGSGGTRPR